ncbi:NACHT domain-containing protein [Pseudomonas chlororaphis]|uniref:NACHT domain-containing protein n=1 Tax=Pseudomonas chlororaphis TaxID=587753 RepID=UPI00209EFC7D|nr:hypothetical protein [Pseudomonas chlororaphis]
MGKSHLLDWLAASPGYSHCTARQLINRYDPKTLLSDAQILVIDALDEVSSQKDGDGVDLVLRQLGKLGYPRFILACRVADWRSATGLEAIHEQYAEKPLELHIEPFNDDDASTFLNATLGSATAKNVIEHFNARGLNGLLGNPQTLELIARVAGSGKLPETRSELFERAIEVLRVEHRDTKARSQPGRETGLDAAGAAFAGLILTGSEAIVRVSAANVAEGELQLSDISLLPGGDVVEAMFGTRLFKADGVDRFTYLHRRVGEYLGAQWLAKQANTPQKRRRLLSLFHSHGLVPSSLRGIHAWLALDPALTNAVIAADPMGLIEYGDADELTADQALLLVSSLELLAKDNPRFRDWGPYTLRGFRHPVVIEDIRRLISTPETSFSLCLLMLEAIRGSEIASPLIDDLRKVVLDPLAFFACRKVAGEILVEEDDEAAWPTVLYTLGSYGDELSVRLAIELADEVGYEQFDAKLIVDLVVAYANSGDRTIGVLMRLEKHLPDGQIAYVLNLLAVAATTLGKRYERPGNDVLTDLVYHLIVRGVEAGGVTAHELWSWLEPFHTSDGYQRDAHQKLHELIRSDDNLRRSVQRLVLLELPSDHNPYQQAWRLSERSTGFIPSDTDVIALLNWLDPTDHSDERWRDLVQLSRHDSEAGTEVRAAARLFAARSPDLLQWLDKLAEQTIPDWQIKQTERERERRAEQAAIHAGHRNHFSARIDQMCAGDYSAIVGPAKAYLNLYNDIEDVPAHKRIGQWLGDDIGEIAHAGFEAFLKLDPPEPTAQQIAKSNANGKAYDAAYIIVAALAERHRAGVGFDDLSDERLMAGLFELRRSRIDDHAGVLGLIEAVEASIQIRGGWKEAMKLYHEPQLQQRCENVDGLYTLMHDQVHVTMSTELAAEWLERFPNLPIGPEIELVDRLIRSGRFEELRRTLALRSTSTNEERRRNWIAIGVIVDFQVTLTQLGAKPIEPELLWHIRHRISNRNTEDTNILLNAAQSEWIINTFRSFWPMVARPSGTSSGDSNPWDASDFIVQLIRRLGNDSSDEAIDALVRLRDAPVDGYSEEVKIVIAEQKRIRVEATYVSPTLAVIAAITRNLTPVSLVDLQTLVLEELAIAQAKIKSDDAESWRGFYDDKKNPFVEERCRDHLLGLLRQGSSGFTFDPETHVAADKEVDITCSAGTLRIPIEIKGQWHSELWTGSDRQLDALYTPDWRAEGRGIYLVLWFGEQKQTTKRLKSPGRHETLPATADELKKMLVAKSRSAREGRVAVFVLDLVRCNPS